MSWYFSQSESSSCGRWQKTQLSVCFIPKEAVTFPENYWPLGNAFESLRKSLIHPAQAPGSSLSVILWGCNLQPLPLSSLTRCHSSSSQCLVSKHTSKGASFPKIHLTEPAFPRISDMSRLFLKPSSCLFLHSDQTQRMGTLELHQKRAFKWVCILV